MTGANIGGGNQPTKTNNEASDRVSPEYLHPLDYPRQMHVNETLNNNNYLDWLQEMENFLFTKNKIGFVDGTLQKPEKTHANYMTWLRCDAMIKGWLDTSMENDVRSSVKYASIGEDI